MITFVSELNDIYYVVGSTFCRTEIGMLLKLTGQEFLALSSEGGKIFLRFFVIHYNNKKGWVHFAQVIDKLSVSYNAPLTDCSQTKTLSENNNSDGKEKPLESGELKLKLG